MKLLKHPVLLAIYFILIPHLVSAQLVINELSQGNGGTAEYVELLVVGLPTCDSNCVDIRGWILDDNGGFFNPGSGAGNAQGHMRFANDPQWACLGMGALIVVYNDGDRNPLIPADDPTDANGDCVYILPASSTLFERNPNTPSSTFPSLYSGPYAPGGSWTQTQLNNSNDSYTVIDPNDLSQAFFAVSWGNNNMNNIIYFAGATGGNVMYMAHTVDNNPFNQANWIQGNAGTDETPGAPNNVANGVAISLLNNNCTPFPNTATVDAGPNLTICEGLSVAYTATGSGAGTYEWSTGDLTANITITPLVNTTYYVTFTETASGCSAVDSAIVTVEPAPLAFAGTDLNICNGETVTLSATGGGTYEWSNGPLTAANMVSPTTTTTYTVTVTSANNCTASDDVTVTVNSLPSADAGSDVQICTGGSVTLTATGGGTYEWSNGPLTATNSVSPAVTTTYTVTVTSANNCTATDDVVVSVGGSLIPGISNDTTICPGSTVGLTASGGTTYTWSPSGSTPTISVSPVVTTTYTVTVTDGGSCTGTASVVVTVDPLPTAGTSATATTICQGQSTTLTATGGASYEWSTTETTASINVNPVTTTTYTVTVSNGGTCTATDDITIAVNPSPPADAGADILICSGTDTTLTASGGGTYIWNTTETTASINVMPFSTTTYTVTVDDGSGCTATDDITVTVSPNNISGTTLPIDVSCSGGSNGSLTINPTGGVGPYSFDISDGTSSFTTTNNLVSNLSEGDYLVTITDAAGCSFTLPRATIGALGGITIDASQALLVSCNGASDASIVVDGIPGLEYSIDNGVFGPGNTFTGLAAGTYTIVGQDAAGCTDTGIVIIEQPDPIVASTTINDIFIETGETTSLNVVATGGNMLTYSWSPEDGLSCSNCPDPLVTPLTNTTYTVIVSDNNDCPGDTVTFNIIIEGEFIFSTPSAFTPNGDGNNDRFRPISNLPLTNFNMKIFNRWGQLVFETDDPEGGWDGIYKDEPQPLSTFVWLMEFNVESGIVTGTQNYQGNVTLIR